MGNDVLTRIATGSTRSRTGGVDKVGEVVQARLNASPYLALREVRFAHRDGVLTLWGHLPTYYLKQLAQALVIEVDGVGKVVNLIEVLSPRR